MRRLAPFAVGVLTVTGFVALGLYLHSVAQDKQKTPGPQFAAATGSPVCCFSPHPEKTEGIQGMVHRGIVWAAGR